MNLKCHKCQVNLKRIEPYRYVKHMNGMAIIFKAIAKCERCGYVHGEVVKVKEVQ